MYQVAVALVIIKDFSCICKFEFIMYRLSCTILPKCTFLLKLITGASGEPLFSFSLTSLSVATAVSLFGSS
ncbi:hypothetical protein CS542_07545 [Pedobacter sp. IW39]|nr:hypothetical protein CS542_07545 [Pedobacter sp. IW39]